MNDFEQAAYNKYEHDFTERTDEQLQTRLNELHENNRQIGYTGERLKQVTNEMSHIAFELSERIREQKKEEIEEAWSEHA